MYRLPLTCLLLTLTLTPLTHATTPPRPLPAASSSSSSSPSLATLLPAISSVLHDLRAAQSDDVSYFTLANRNLRLVLGGLLSPLQLLDWSHWSTDPFASVIHSNTRSVDDGWRAEEEEFAAHGDPSHVLRATVNAHKQAAVRHTPHRSHPTSQPSLNHSPVSSPLPATSTTFTALGTTTTGSATDIDNIDAPDDVCVSYGVPVRFTRYNNRTGRYEDTSLCYCPADYTASTCATRQSYRCRLQLTADTNNACTTVRTTPIPTAYSAHSETLPPVHLSPSGSEFYTYEPMLSGPAAPCLSLADERSMLEVNFTCHFADGNGVDTVGVEGFNSARLAYRLSMGYRLNDTLPVLRYTVKNVDSTTGGLTFAVSGNVQLGVSVRLHNTAHPSQYRQTVHALTAAHLQLNTTNGDRTLPLAVLADVASIEPNLKRGGRLLLALRWHDITGGLVRAGSGLPWQLTVEDGTWELPGPTKRVWLSGWQTVGVVLTVVVVLLLLVWRWYQNRQTARMQALLAEQRGKQQSWFEHAE